LSGRKRKLRPDLAGTDTLDLLAKVEAEALRLRAENKRLAAELSSARKKVAALEKRVKPGRKAAVTVMEVVPANADVDGKPVEKKAPARRQALGTGLARFLGPRRLS
jgi:hypothetical protein